jgi:hypothetical protein
MNKKQYKIMARTPKGVDLIYMTLDDFDSVDNILSYLDKLLNNSTWLDGWKFWGIYERE